MADAPTLDLIYQDDFLLVINKPSGLHSTINPNNPAPSIAALLLEKFPQVAGVGKGPFDGGLINRLDFSTCGLLLAALNQDSWKSLFQSLQQKEIEKRYYALVEGKAPQEITIDGFIGSPYRRSKKVRVYKTFPKAPSRALPAQSSLKRICFHQELNLSLVEFVVHCARRHQIRAHSAEIGHPLLGDILYGSKIPFLKVCAFTKQNEETATPQFFLQAYYLAFKHPVTKERLLFSLALPPQLGFLAGLGQNSAGAYLSPHNDVK